MSDIATSTMMDALPIAVAGLAGLSVAILIWSSVGAAAERRAILGRRMSSFIAEKDPAEQSLEAAAMEARQASRIGRERKRQIGALGIRAHLVQAGLDWSLLRALLCLPPMAAPVAMLSFLAGVSAPGSLLLGAASAPGLAVLVLTILKRRRKKAMESEFPSAMDVIVRGVKSGLPLNQCIAIVARETSEPLCSEFALMVEHQRHGVPVADSVERFAARVPLTEANFFAIVIALQTRTGGRLAESLDNLVGVLRARTQLRAKIKSMSAEAKASGAIIAAMPPAVATMVYFTSPDYIGILFEDLVGQFVLAGCAIWMMIGVAVMTKMISFDY